MKESTRQEQPEQEYGWVREGRALPLHQVIFWLHLVTGAMASLIIFVMSVTGVVSQQKRWQV
jgi:hypothetical protein